MKKIITILGAFLLVFAFVGVVSAATPDNLVGWWQFEYNILDFTDYDNDGVVQNNVTYASGQIGQAAVFNGSDSYVRVADSDSLDITDEITIESWVQADAWNGYRTIVSKRSGSVANYAFRISGGTMEFYYRGSSDGVWSEWTTNAVVISDAAWHHVAVTYKSGDSDVKIYVDGDLKVGHWLYGTYNPVTENNFDVYIGSIGGSQYFDGLIDELRIWNSVLAVDELNDSDLDGYGDAVDCDDNNAAINPGATEVCDGVDNDCNGIVDGITRGTTCGVGACAENTGIETCTAGIWGGDTCDPFEGATEEVCDTLDNDCDGTTDQHVCNWYCVTPEADTRITLFGQAANRLKWLSENNFSTVNPKGKIV